MSQDAFSTGRRVARTATPPNRLNRFLRTPKGLALVTLVVLALTSIIVKHDVKSFEISILGVLTGFLGDLVVGLFYRKKRFVSDGGIITGLIVAMVLGPLTPWYVTVATTVIALASKHLLRVKRRPILNPAAVGLLLSNYVFTSMQSWWGGMSLVSYWYLIPLVGLGFFVARRAKKLPGVAAFLAAYALMGVVFLADPHTHTEASYAFLNPMLNSALFLAFFMLTDPPTSPGKPRHQIWFGALVGVVSMGVYLVNPGELTYLLVALLAANVLKLVINDWLLAGARRRRSNLSQPVSATID